MPTVETEVRIYCDKCGDDLDWATTVKLGTKLYIEPCERCLEAAHDEGYDDGRNEVINQREDKEG